MAEEERMKLYQIEVDLGIDHQWVQACLNVWKFPKDIRDNVFGLTRGSKAYKIHTSNGTIEVFFVDHRKRAYQKLEQLRREEVI